MQKFVYLLCVGFLLSGCWKNHSVNKFNNASYMKATSVAPIKIPAELASTTSIEPYYPAPSGKYPEPGAAPISLVPPGLGELVVEKEDEK